MKASPRSTLSNPALPCPICQQPSHRLFEKYGHWIRRCQTCHHRFAELRPTAQHVQSTYSDDYFEGGGAGYPNYLAEADLLRQHGRRYAQILSRHLPPGRLLDVGAAAGFILQGLIDSGWQGQGVEPNPSMSRHARDRLHLPVQTGTLEQLDSGDRYDVISMIQVIAHFYDLQSALRQASRHTKPGGYWLIETWNAESWTARLLGRHWHEYSPPSVLHWLSPRRLKILAAQHGFYPVEQGRPAKWLNGAHAKSLLRYKLLELPAGKLLSRSLAVIPDRWAIPYPAEDLFWMLLRRD